MEYKIYQLLDIKSNNILSILDIISRKEKWYKTQELAEMLNITERSAQRHINDLYDEIALFSEYTESEISIQQGKGSGILLHSESVITISKLKEFIFRKNEAVIFLMSVLLGSTNVTLPSKSVIDKTNYFLSQFDLSLSSDKKDVKGQEHTIRIVIYGIINQIYKTVLFPSELLYTDINKLKKEVSVLSSILNLELSTSQTRDLMILTSINIIRFNKKKTISSDDLTSSLHLLSGSNEWTIQNFCTDFYKHYRIYDSNEILFLSINIAIRPFIYESSKLHNAIFDSHKSKNSLLYQSVILFMKKFSETIHTIPEEKYNPIFLYVFRSHLFGSLYKKVDYDYNGNIYFQEKIHRYDDYNEMLNSFIIELQEHSNISIYSNKDYLLQIYYVVLSYINPKYFLKNKINLFIKSDLPEIYKKSLEDRIFDRFKYDYYISLKKLKYTEDVDLILTTNFFYQSHENIIHINFPPTELDYKNIDHALYLLSHQEENS